MATITIPRSSTVFVDEGVLVTYQGTPNTCTYWEVVGVVASVEGAAVGSLLQSIIMTDANGFAVNQYIGSGLTADVGKTERIKVSEGA